MRRLGFVAIALAVMLFLIGSLPASTVAAPEITLTVTGFGAMSGSQKSIMDGIFETYQQFDETRSDWGTASLERGATARLRFPQARVYKLRVKFSIEVRADNSASWFYQFKVGNGGKLASFADGGDDTVTPNGYWAKTVDMTVDIPNASTLADEIEVYARGTGAEYSHSGGTKNDVQITIRLHEIQPIWTAGTGGTGDTTPPTCAFSYYPGSEDPNGFAYMKVTLQDGQSGLAGYPIAWTNGQPNGGIRYIADNLSFFVPDLPSGSTAPYVNQFWQNDKTRNSRLELTFWDLGGNVRRCYQAIMVVPDGTKPATYSFTSIPQANSKLKIQNGKPGLSSLRVAANGKIFDVSGLADRQVRDLDLASAMVPGDPNAIVLTGQGPQGSSAGFLLWSK